MVTFKWRTTLAQINGHKPLSNKTKDQVTTSIKNINKLMHS